MFCKEKPQSDNIKNYQLEMRWLNTEIYDKSGKDAKKLNTDEKLQYSVDCGRTWKDVYYSYNMPIFLDKN